MQFQKGKCYCETDCIWTKVTGKENFTWKRGSGGVKEILQIAVLIPLTHVTDFQISTSQC